ncbi:MAG TPA: hypothetical protein VFZ93_14355 [Albitalea sp.]
MKPTDPSLPTRRAFLAATLVLAGCQHLLEEPEPPRRAKVHVPTPSQNMRREAVMNEQWQNHRYSELVAALGTPTMVMNIPGGGNPPGFAVVFGRDPATGCIDAFAMMYGTDPIVRTYYCR